MKCDGRAAHGGAEMKAATESSVQERTYEPFAGNIINDERQLGRYCFVLRNFLRVEKSQLEEEGAKEKALAAVQATLDWLGKNQLAERDEIEAKGQELQEVVLPLLGESAGDT